MIQENVLVISAHAVDFVWRCSGTIASYAAKGHKVKIVDITFGQRGESNDVWKKNKEITEEEVIAIRKKEAEAAAKVLGAEIEFLHLTDHLLELTRDNKLELAKIMKEFQPGIILTHFTSDPLNYDHPETAHATLSALRAAQVWGVNPGLKTVQGAKVFMFEPDQPEFCGFNPDTFIDITEVMELKKKAMDICASQEYLVKNYTSRAEHRAYLAQRISGNNGIQYAEAFKRFNPYVGKAFA